MGKKSKKKSTQPKAAKGHPTKKENPKGKVKDLNLDKIKPKTADPKDQKVATEKSLAKK